MGSNMKKNDVFTFTAPNGVEVTAVVVGELSGSYDEWDDSLYKEFLCYSQNRLFSYGERYKRKNAFTPEETIFTTEHVYGKILVDYCILPDYDAMLEAEQQKFDDDCYEALSSIGNIEF